MGRRKVQPTSPSGKKCHCLRKTQGEKVLFFSGNSATKPGKEKEIRRGPLALDKTIRRTAKRETKPYPQKCPFFFTQSHDGKKKGEALLEFWHLCVGSLFKYEKDFLSPEIPAIMKEKSIP